MCPVRFRSHFSLYSDGIDRMKASTGWFSVKILFRSQLRLRLCQLVGSPQHQVSKISGGKYIVFRQETRIPRRTVRSAIKHFAKSCNSARPVVTGNM